MISASLQQRKTRTRRSMLFVPGANAAMVSNSFIYPADRRMFAGDSILLKDVLKFQTKGTLAIINCLTLFTS